MCGKQKHYDPILWIDDNAKMLKETIKKVEHDSLDVVGTTSYSHASRLIQKYNYSLVLLDLEMPEIDGIEAYNQLAKQNFEEKTIIVSAHVDHAGWKSRYLNLKLKHDPIDFPFPRRSSRDYPPIIKHISSNRRPNRVVRSNGHITLHDATDPFFVNYDIFCELSLTGKAKLCKKAHSLANNEIIRTFKQNKELEYLLLSKKPGQIVIDSYDKNPFIIINPKKYKKIRDKRKLASFIKEYSKSYRFPVYAVSRPAIIEDLRANYPTSNSLWSNKGPANEEFFKGYEDFYPTIKLNHISPSSSVNLECSYDFDTGSDQSYIDFNFLSKNGLIDEDQEQLLLTKEVRGKKMCYFAQDSNCEIVGTSKTRAIILSYNVVLDWSNREDNPITEFYNNRRGLIGRDIFIKNNLKILLKGNKKETDVF